jgi:hypothetical protein
MVADVTPKLWEMADMVKVLDEPVSGEPVSGEDSLRSGKRTGNFVKIGPFGKNGKKPPVRT